ncbi:MAG: hypothetical protein ACHQNT_01145 [Bacteroidia bacterium]
MQDEHTRTVNAAKAGSAKMDEPAFQPLWIAKIAVKNKKDAIDVKIQDMEDLDDGITIQGGNTTAKDEARVTAATNAWQICRPLKIFAKDTNDEVLAGEVDLTWSEIRFGKAQTLIDNWQLIHDRANSNLAALTAGGYIDGALVPQLLLDIGAFVTASPKPKTAQSQIKAINIELEKEWEKLKVLMEEMRELLVQFAVSQPIFYNAAIEAFDEDETGVRHQSLVVTYEDEITGVKLEDVFGKLVEKNLEKKSTKKIGVITFMQQETGQGNLTLESKHPLYATDLKPNLAVKDGEVLRLTVKLRKV